jgi:hypothetical protein
MNFSKDMVFKQIDAVICDLRHLLISIEEFQENGDTNKLQKRIEELEKEVKWWQDRYNELYKNYLELLGCPRQKYRPYQPIWINSPTNPYEYEQPIWVNKTYSSDSFTFTL